MRRAYLLIAVLAFVIAAFLPFGAASANQLRTPGLSIFVINAPKDLKLFIQYRHSLLPEPLEMERTLRYWETYYNYYYQRLPGRFDEDFIGAKLIVQSSQYSYELPILRDLEMRVDKRIMTLDLKQGTLVYGEPGWRAPLSVAGRVVLTLVLEGAVFFLFGYARQIKLDRLLHPESDHPQLSEWLSGAPDRSQGDFFMLIFYMVGVILIEAAIYYFTFKEVELSPKALLLV